MIEHTAMYQIDCQMTKKGKMFAGTKRRICWRFGFANPVAVNAGQTGTDCRGEEHEVVMVWSLTSGKRFVLADGHEVHWSKSRRLDKFECAWDMAGGHRLEVAAHVSAPLFEKSGFRQFELKIDGVAFTNMPMMFQLGLTKPVGDRSRIRSAPACTGPMDEMTGGRERASSYATGTLYRSQPHLPTSLLDSPSCSLSPSPSMPNLVDLASTWCTTPSATARKVPSASSVEMPSPTSVMMNPFDLYAAPLPPYLSPSQQQLRKQDLNSPYHAQLDADDIFSHYAPSLQQQQRQPSPYYPPQMMTTPPTNGVSHYYPSQCPVYAGY
jgi:hypothetical protein